MTLASGQASPKGIAVGGGSVVWVTNVAAGTVQVVPTGGGTPQTLATGEPYASDVAADGTTAYWTNAASSGGGVFSTPLAGGVRRTLFTAGGSDFPTAIGVANNTIYWSNYNSAQILKVPAAGTAADVVALASGGGVVGYVGLPLWADASDVFWASGVGVRKVSVAGGTMPVTLASSGGPVAIYASFVYYFNSSANQFQRVAKTGGSAINLGPAAGVVDMEVDASFIYWIDGAAVKRIPRSGGSAANIETLATAQTSPARLALDADAVYWTNAGSGSNGQVRKIAK